MTDRNKKIVLFGAIAGVAGCAGDFLVVFVFGNYYPGYSQLYNTVSSLGATISPVSNIVSSLWILLGIFFVVFGYSMRKAFRPETIYVKVASWLIIIYGLGEFVGSGLFKADHIGNTVTHSAVVHGILGTIGIATLMVLPLVMLKIIQRSTNPGFHKLSWIVLIAGIVIMVLFNFHFFHPEDNILNKLEGLWQRLFALDYYIYLFVVISMMIKTRFASENSLTNE
jgi:hypothetical protein